MPEIARQPARGGRRAPERHAGDDDVATTVTVGGQRNGNGHQRIENAERRALQQPDLEVVQAQVQLDVVHHQRDDLPVEKGEDRADEEDDDDVPGVALARPRHVGVSGSGADSHGDVGPDKVILLDLCAGDSR